MLPSEGLDTVMRSGIMPYSSSSSLLVSIIPSAMLPLSLKLSKAMLAECVVVFFSSGKLEHKWSGLLQFQQTHLSKLGCCGQPPQLEPFQCWELQFGQKEGLDNTARASSEFCPPLDYKA